MTGTAIELPKALYRCPMGQSSAGLLRQGICVQLSGKPCRRSHSMGVRRLTCEARNIAFPRPSPDCIAGDTPSVPYTLQHWGCSGVNVTTACGSFYYLSGRFFDCFSFVVIAF